MSAIFCGYAGFRSCYGIIEGYKLIGNAFQARNQEALVDADMRGRSRRIFTYAVWIAAIVTSLKLLSLTGESDTPSASPSALLSVWFLSLIIALLLRTVRYSRKNFPPAWLRYLWPLALPLCLLSLDYGAKGSEKELSIDPGLWVVLVIYVISTLIIAGNVRSVVRFAKKERATFSRGQYAEALRSARTFLWAVPAFVVVAILATSFPVGDENVSDATLAALRNQLFGVIGAASVIAAVTAVPAEANGLRRDYFSSSKQDKLTHDLTHLMDRVEILTTEIGRIKAIPCSGDHPMKARTSEPSAGASLKTLLGPVISWINGRMHLI